MSTLAVGDSPRGRWRSSSAHPAGQASIRAGQGQCAKMCDGKWGAFKWKNRKVVTASLSHDLTSSVWRLPHPAVSR